MFSESEGLLLVFADVAVFVIVAMVVQRRRRRAEDGPVDIVDTRPGDRPDDGPRRL